MLSGGFLLREAGFFPDGVCLKCFAGCRADDRAPDLWQRRPVQSFQVHCL